MVFTRSTRLSYQPHSINVSSTLNIKAGYKFIKLYQLLIYNDLIINQLKTKHLSCT
jgi:hypothetical protein